MPLSIFPIDILKELLQYLPEKNYIPIGDKLGTIINNNSQIIGLQTLEEKRGLIQGLNWINFTPVTLIDVEDDPKSKEKQKSKNNPENKKQIKIQYWGIPKDIWPLEMIHAMLFRIKYNQRYNSHWESSTLKKFLRQTKKKRIDFKKNPKRYTDFNKVKDFILKIAFEIGSRKENFENEFNYYYFDVFRIEEDKNQE